MNFKGLHFGWVVLIATFYINLVVDGYCFVFGIVRMYLEEDYPEYPSFMVALIGGLVPAIYLGIAPVCMAINDFLGPTRVIIFASLISTAAFVLAWLNFFFKAGFYFDLFMLGIFQGISSALLYGPSIAVVAEYFPPNQRSLAAGITTCGSPVGAIFYSLIIPPLFAEYGWRGALVIFSCFNLNGIICAMCFLDSLRPGYEPPKPAPKLERRRQEQDENTKHHKHRHHKHHHKHHHHHGSEHGSEQPLRADVVERQPNRPPSSLGSEDTYQAHLAPVTFDDQRRLPPDGTITSAQSERKEKTFMDVLKTYFNVKLVFQLSFLSILGAAAFSIIGYYIPTLLVPAQAQKEEWGCSPFVKANLLSLWGAVNTIGRAVTGRMADLGLRYTLLTSYWIFIIGLAISAAVLIVFPFFMFLGDVSFVLFVLLYGFFIAPVITMRSIIVADMYGEENASASFGWFLFAQGIVQVIGFILPAMLDQLSALYAYGFGAICFLLAGACVAATFKPYFTARRKTLETLKQKENAPVPVTIRIDGGAPTEMVEYVF